MKLFLLTLLAVSAGLGSAGVTNLRLREKFLTGSKCTKSGKEDCGYYGIKENGCVAKGCCWDPTPHPQQLAHLSCYNNLGPAGYA